MQITHYFRHARVLPPRLLLRKATAFALRGMYRLRQLIADAVFGSHGAEQSGWKGAAQIKITPLDIPAALEQTLRALGATYLQHRFDLLGSGWVAPSYGFRPAGFLGHRHVAPDRVQPAPTGHGLERVVNRSNLRTSLRCWALIKGEGYQPIDWQLDFRTGYSWSARRHSYNLPIPVDIGTDVKVPWELGRLQHLPQLALCAILATGGRSGFEPAGRYVQEIADQLLDFIATNPPRYGVNWMCTMDVGIRAANMALALALLAGAGLKPDGSAVPVILGSLRDHAAHIVDHLEYSERGRSNHYIANVAGLLWASWLLDDEESDRRLAFAIAEILNEADVQFLRDGGNYEGSTSYHRLSAEMLLFSLAAILSLGQESLSGIERANPPRRSWRAAFPKLPFARHRQVAGPEAIVPHEVLAKLRRAADLSRAVQGADGTIVQIGDTDSGRFFKLHPTALPAAFGGHDDDFAENTLDHTGLVDGIDALFGASTEGRRLEAVVVKRLAGNVAFERGEVVAQPDFGDLDALQARWQATPESSRRVRRLPLGTHLDPAKWTRSSFPDFGLYVFRHDNGFLLTFRCLEAIPAIAPRGHTHDDNLAIEYRLDPVVARDPGSFVYTPSIELRNRYRSAAAHDVPRTRGEPVAAPGPDLFDLRHRYFAKCLAWKPDGVAGEINGPSGRVLRVIHFLHDEIVVWDCADPPSVLEPILADIEPSKGYGRL